MSRPKTEKKWRKLQGLKSEASLKVRKPDFFFHVHQGVMPVAADRRLVPYNSMARQSSELISVNTFLSLWAQSMISAQTGFNNKT